MTQNGMEGGRGIQISIVDDAIQTNHEDLSPNLIQSASLNVAVTGGSYRNNPYPDSGCDASHGTAVAGIAVAKGNNNLGIRGIAPNATFWGANYLASSTDTNLGAIGAHRSAETAVSINSWGPDDPTRLSPSHSYIDLAPTLLHPTSGGFAGKGISYIFAAGNNGDNRRDAMGDPILNSGNMASYYELQNHIGIISVCSVDFDDEVSSYSEPGPSVWLCGYSNTGRKQIDFSMPASSILHHPTDYNNYTDSSFTPFYYYGLPTTDLSGGHGINNNSNALDTHRTDMFSIAFSESNPGTCDRIELTGALEFGTQRFSQTSTGACMPTFPVQTSSFFTSWPGGNLNSYTRYFTGTSAAAPLVGGIVALLRAEKPSLSWRDIKLILAESAWQPAHVLNDPATQTTGRVYSNLATHSPNYTFHPHYGFGIVNASKAMEIAQSWTTLPVLQPSITRPASRFTSLNLATTPSVSHTGTANFTVSSRDAANLDFIEYVYLHIQEDPSRPNTNTRVTQNFGDLRIELSSPDGVTSVFSVPHTCVEKPSNLYRQANNCPAFSDVFRFGSNVNLGEPIFSPTANSGTWTLTITDTDTTNKNDVAGLQAQLTFVGHNRRP